MKDNIKNSERLLHIEDLHFHFDRKRPVLKGIDLSLGSGQFVVLAGANGSGKSVLMKHLNGLLKPVKGDVHYRGRSIYSMLAAVRPKVGLVFQNADTQIVEQTVYDEVAFGPRNLGWDKERIKGAVSETMAHLGIDHLAALAPHFLSGGEKKKVTIAGVLVMDPELIILDEPFAGLDYPGVVAVTREIVTLHKKGHAVVVITHDLEKILAHAERLVIMKDGKITYDGVPSVSKKLYEANSLYVPYGNKRPIKSMTWLV